MQEIFKRIVPHFIIVILFAGISLAYFSPVLDGKEIYQSDIVQYIGMANQQKEFAKSTGQETYWTNAAFGGMPTYQLGALYAHNYIKKLDTTLRFLPRPADYLFLYFIGIYILFLSLKVDYRLGFIGALAFGFSTYLIIILGVGHNAKAHAVAYMPLVLSGILLALNRKYILGFIITAVGMGLHLVANHFQMTYYFLLLVLCIGVVYLVQAIKEKTLPELAKAIGVLVVAVAFGLAMNATNILATQEYAKESTRGKSELTIDADGLPKAQQSGLNYDYITEYSYGKLESINLFIPRFMGGGSGEGLPKDSKTFEFLIREGLQPVQAADFVENLPSYWGDQPIVAAPAYVGAVVMFLAILSLFLIKARLRNWLLAGVLLSLFLSWGKNFSLLTDLFINYMPLYDKFRAVSSIQVLLEMLLPIMAILGLQAYFFSSEKTTEEKQKALLVSTGILGGFILLLILFRNSLFTFAGAIDAYLIQQLGPELVSVIRKDRATIMYNDSIRSLIFVLLSAGLLFMTLKKTDKKWYAIIGLGLLIVIDLVGVDRRYVNSDDFVSPIIMQKPFEKDGADLEILKDETHFRVFDLTRNAFNSTHASYFHNSIGGYHAAKPKRMQDIYDFYLAEQPHMGILNMLNVKYIMTANDQGGTIAQRNPFANGSAWFVDDVIYTSDANQEILALDTLNNKKYAVSLEANKSEIEALVKDSQRDEDAFIEIKTFSPNELVYEYSSETPQVAVFSEAYYPYGWKVYVGEEEASYFKINYLQRGMALDKGSYEIRFVFEPEVVQAGTRISLLSSLVFLLSCLGLGFLYFKKQKE